MNTTAEQPRRYQRADFHRSVRLRVPTWMNVEAAALDLSEGGIRLCTPMRMIKGDVAFVQLGLDSTLELGAEVRWAQPSVDCSGDFVVGLRWMTLESTEANGLSQLVEQHLPC